MVLGTLTPILRLRLMHEVTIEYSIQYSKRLARPYMPSLIVTGSVLSVDGSWYAYPYPALATNA